jgi:hypothetical protein
VTIDPLITQLGHRQRRRGQAGAAVASGDSWEWQMLLDNITDVGQQIWVKIGRKTGTKNCPNLHG